LPGVGRHADANHNANGGVADGHGHANGWSAALPGVKLHADAGCYADGGAADRHTHVDADAHCHAASRGCG
jgi:hypothetical protein